MVLFRSSCMCKRCRCTHKLFNIRTILSSSVSSHLFYSGLWEKKLSLQMMDDDKNKLNTGNTWIIIGWSLPKLCLCGLEKMATTPWHCIVYDITYWSEWVSEWFLFNANSAILQTKSDDNSPLYLMSHVNYKLVLHHLLQLKIML
jgi:hypothetical protein